MKKDTKKFGLLIVDDEPKWRAIYKEWLSDPDKGHYRLKDIWDSDSIKEYENANSALEYIREYKEKGDYHLLVVADAYMPPNCDGSNVTDDNKLFGGLWLIDEVNKDTELKDFVTILLVTFYDDRIKSYLRGNNQELFNREEGKDNYFFVKKPYPESSGLTVDAAISELSKASNKVRDGLFKKTYEAIWKIKETPPSKADISNIIGTSKSIKDILTNIEKVAPTNSKVLITGESGTGKKLIAKAIHYKSSRSSMPFITINCANLPETLLESELFGHEKGAFTGAESPRTGRFELAKTGTIFLDEVGEMNPSTQAKLLRILEDGEFERLGSNKTIKVDVRIVAATNKNLQQEINEGEFRNDLYYRLSVINIHLPPLSERAEDIPLLVEHFLNKICKRENLPKKQLDEDAMDLLKEYSWPGNVRELENVIERLVILSTGKSITADDVQKFGQLKEPIKSKVIFTGLISHPEVDKEYLRYILEQTNWNVKKAAEITGKGLDDKTIYLKIREYGWIKS